MMAIELPAPRLTRGGLSHNAEPVKVLTVLIEPAGHLHDGFIETHNVPRGLKPLDAQRLSQQREGALALGVGHFEKRHAMAHQGSMDIAPFPPLDSVYREEGFEALLQIQRREELFSGRSDRISGYSSFLDREKTRNYRSIGSDSFERFRDRLERILDVTCGPAAQAQRPLSRGACG